MTLDVFSTGPAALLLRSQLRDENDWNNRSSCPAERAISARMCSFLSLSLISAISSCKHLTKAEPVAEVLLSGSLVESNALHAEAGRRTFEHFGIPVDGKRSQYRPHHALSRLIRQVYDCPKKRRHKLKRYLQNPQTVTWWLHTSPSEMITSILKIAEDPQ